MDIIKANRDKIKKLKQTIKKKALYNKRLKDKLDFLENEIRSYRLSDSEYQYADERECAVGTFCRNLLEESKKFKID